MKSCEENTEISDERAFEYLKPYEERRKNPDERTFEQMKYVDYDKEYNTEYGIYHFRIPNPLLRKASFDCSGETTFWSKSISHEYTRFYKPIPPPGKNDWLMNHKEYGQTYLEYKRKGYHEITNKKFSSIFINFDQISKNKSF